MTSVSSGGSGSGGGGVHIHGTGRVHSSALIAASETIASASLHIERPNHARLDIVPFLFLYAPLVIIYFFFITDDTPHNGVLALIVAIGTPLMLLGHAITWLATKWSVGVNAYLRFYRLPDSDVAVAKFIRVVPLPHCGSQELCPLVTVSVQNVSSSSRDDDVVAPPSFQFFYQQTKYTYSESDHKFHPLDFPDTLPIGQYLAATGYLSPRKLQLAATKYGLNEFDIPLPPFSSLFAEHATAPFFVFQVFCVGLWCLDEYWYYSIVTLVMLIIFECTVVARRLRNLQDVRSMRVRPYPILVFREQKWTSVHTHQLLPSDVCSIVRSKDGLVSPCDMLLIRGSCVANEALLTGESVPQLKEAVEPFDAASPLSSERHKRSILFGGTSVLLASNDKDKEVIPEATAGAAPPAGTAAGKPYIKAPPDGGAIAVVLRTGFNTQQGKLIRTILFSTERVTVNNTESLVFIGFLLIFAFVAAGYVLAKGLEDASRSRYKLLLNCIMIVTSVVPPELPMELSLAVHTSLIALAKHDIFCTEPFRIPSAGGVTVCCFDKTGTLTSDEFVLQGIGGLGQWKVKKDGTTVPELVPASNVSDETKFVIGGCHSLVFIDNKLVGDPVERAALHAIEWSYAKGDVAVSRSGKLRVRIVHRYAFSSELKRMSCVVALEHEPNIDKQLWVVAKGAPEIMASRYAKLPDRFDSMHRYFSRQGYRVLALGYKPVNRATVSEIRQWSRESSESELQFGGFLVLHCPLKYDSLDTIKALSASSHRVVMITGDHVLTACRVARDLTMVSRPVLMLADTPAVPVASGPGNNSTSSTSSSSSDAQADGEAEGDDEKKEDVPLLSVAAEASELVARPHLLHWVSPDEQTVKPFDPNGVSALAAEYDLCLSGSSMKILAEQSGLTARQFEDIMCHVSVFARTSPYQKETVLTSLKNRGFVTLMCGDGTNDVGALKQAHVGVALIGSEAPKGKGKAGVRGGPTGSSRGGTSNSAKRVLVDKSTKPKDKTNGPTSTTSVPPAAGTKPGQPASLQDRMTQLQKQYNLPEDDEVPMIRLGDASIASPFTSKIPFIGSTLHIIRQGRCTLVTTMQMYKILALNCLVSAYSLSVLYLDGVKLGDTQATCAGLSVALFFLAISRSKPVHELSAERPPSSIFSLYMMLSIAGQFAMHFTTLLLAVQWSKPHTPDDEETKSPEGKFKPNVLNSVVFLVSTLMTVATFAVNYRGRPFMESLPENRALCGMLAGWVVILFACALHWFPPLNEFLEIVELPSEEFRYQLVSLFLVDLVVVFVWERVLLFLLSRPPKGFRYNNTISSSNNRIHKTNNIGSSANSTKKKTE